MSDIVEYGYVNFPPMAAKLYDAFMVGRATSEQVRQIAVEITSTAMGGRLLDVGTGPGRILVDLHQLRPELELFGLDIADSMIELARQNTDSFEPDLRVGTIRHTDYPSDSFDFVTCTGSFYVWREPVACLDEIHRILKPGGRAILFETYRDFPKLAFLKKLAAVTVHQDFLRGLFSPLLLGQQLRMTYRLDEIESIIGSSLFSHSFSMRKKVIAQLPIWVRIELCKEDERAPGHLRECGCCD